MLIVNGRKFAKNNKEFIDSLFHSGGTCVGFYKVTKNGIKLFDQQNKLFAFIVNNRYDEQFFVSAGTFEGRPYYMHSTCSITEKYLGIEDFGYMAQIKAAQDAIKSLTN